ncbi:IS66 family insertion sequence element accessory protein TnpA [Botrimarina hoheduenensis]|uniref:IS66 family insertion sequence element accessory protein TnpA n=1 Tax=Botrimarina hoheduenensis TaxID=2528000 RepID=UPI0018D39D19|nr:transposase [Botrimarina hoheduenensis]
MVHRSGEGQDGAKERVWRELVSRQAASGLSVRAFCRREGVSEASFYGWRRALGRRAGGPPPFVPVVVSDVPIHREPAASLALELRGGRVLRLPASTRAAWLAELLTAIASGDAR